MKIYPGHSPNPFPIEEPTIGERFHLYLHTTRQVDFCDLCGLRIFPWETAKTARLLDELRIKEGANGKPVISTRSFI